MKDIIITILKFILSTFMAGLGKSAGCGNCSCEDS